MYSLLSLALMIGLMAQTGKDSFWSQYKDGTWRTFGQSGLIKR